MKHLEFLKFPTYKASFYFHFFSNFLFLSLLSFSSWRSFHYYGSSDVSDVGEVSKIPTSDLKLILQNGVRGEIGIVSIGYILNCQINDYQVNTQSVAAE